MNVPEYLDSFHKKLRKKWAGSLIKVEYVKEIEPNAKEYLNKLAKTGLVERIAWGWYWVPAEIEDVWDFLAKNKNFKVVSSQTAASFWDYDFVHRDVYNVKVEDRSYGKALETFGKQKGWDIHTEYVEKTSEIKYTKVGGIFVESIEDSIIDCIKRWAFSDAFATLYAQRDKIRLKRLVERVYWARIPKTDVRVKQALMYGCSRINELTGKKMFKLRKQRLSDEFVRRDIDEAIEKVVEFG